MHKEKHKNFLAQVLQTKSGSYSKAQVGLSVQPLLKQGTDFKETLMVK